MNHIHLTRSKALTFKDGEPKLSGVTGNIGTMLDVSTFLATRASEEETECRVIREPV